VDRTAIPAGDAYVVDAGIEDLEDLDVLRCPEWVGQDLRLQWNGRQLSQDVAPEYVEVIGLPDLRPEVPGYSVRHGLSSGQRR